MMYHCLYASKYRDRKIYPADAKVENTQGVVSVECVKGRGEVMGWSVGKSKTRMVEGSFPKKKEMKKPYRAAHTIEKGSDNKWWGVEILHIGDATLKFFKCKSIAFPDKRRMFSEIKSCCILRKILYYQNEWRSIHYVIGTYCIIYCKKQKQINMFFITKKCSSFQKPSCRAEFSNKHAASKENSSHTCY